MRDFNINERWSSLTKSNATCWTHFCDLNRCLKLMRGSCLFELNCYKSFTVKTIMKFEIAVREVREKNYANWPLRTCLAINRNHSISLNIERLIIYYLNLIIGSGLKISRCQKVPRAKWILIHDHKKSPQLRAKPFFSAGYFNHSGVGEDRSLPFFHSPAQFLWTQKPFIHNLCFSGGANLTWNDMPPTKSVEIGFQNSLDHPEPDRLSKRHSRTLN